MNFDLGPRPAVFSHATPRPDYPAMKWHPVTGEYILANDASEVPAGYLDTHPNNLPAVTVAPPARMDRKDIILCLQDGAIPYKANAPTKALYELLLLGLKAALSAAEIAFDQESTDATALLSLFPKA